MEIQTVEKRLKNTWKVLERSSMVKERSGKEEIIAAWVITVPAAVLSAAIYFMIRGIVL